MSRMNAAGDRIPRVMRGIRMLVAALRPPRTLSENFRTGQACSGKHISPVSRKLEKDLIQFRDRSDRSVECYMDFAQNLDGIFN